MQEAVLMVWIPKGTHYTTVVMLGYFGIFFNFEIVKLFEFLAFSERSEPTDLRNWTPQHNIPVVLGSKLHLFTSIQKLFMKSVQ